MTKMEILELVKEMHAEEKKTEKVPHYYMRGGQVRERSYPDYIYTDRYKELFFSDDSPLRCEKIFRSSESGKMYAYLDLEAWVCDFDEDYYISSEEYEEEMGDDL